MRKLFITFAFTLATLTLSAIPAKQGVWQTLHLTDGTEIKAQLMGDEHMHFWVTTDGRQYTLKDDGTAVPADMEQLRKKALSRRATIKASQQRLRSPQRVNIGEKTHYTGQKKGIVILMQFSDTKFKAANDLAKFNDIMNHENYTADQFKGSVADYFRAQSDDQFQLTFDVLGPYTAQHVVSYYGKNDSYGNDQHADELIVEAVEAADEEVDYHDYDWDNDGQVDQVFVVYAGRGEADGGGDKTIWPHMWFLAETGMSIQLDGVTINTYACANEITSGGALSGIGCFCHEFSHCLGFPDFYDTAYQGWFGMNKFDLMDQGSYNGNGFLPSGYTAYEKWMAGWLELKELGEENDTVTQLKPMSEHGDAYILYNDGNRNEYYIIENRQLTQWDAKIPGKGLMITHVDFDKEIWEQNTPNTKVTQSDVMANPNDLTKTNDHQRFTIFHADNQDDSQYWNSYWGSYTQNTVTTDLYPYNKNDSLTATSQPAATLYNENLQGTKKMQGAILKIKQNSDRTMDFIYRAKPDSQGSSTDDPVVPPTDPDEPVVARGDTLFYESFDQCAGIGANDGNWNTNIAQSSSKFFTDNKGWKYEAAYGGYQCARFGNATKSGQTTTPLFTINGEAELSFKVAGWNTDDTQLSLSITDNSDESATIVGDTQINMESFNWTEHVATITGTGTLRLTFTPAKRFILDEVLVLDKNETTGIVYTGNGDRKPEMDKCYDLQGRQIANSPLRKGIYIIGGRKEVR